MSGSFSDSPTHDDKFSVENDINGSVEHLLRSFQVNWKIS